MYINGYIKRKIIPEISGGLFRRSCSKTFFEKLMTGTSQDTELKGGKI